MWVIRDGYDGERVFLFSKEEDAKRVVAELGGGEWDIDKVEVDDWRVQCRVYTHTFVYTPHYSSTGGWLEQITNTIGPHLVHKDEDVIMESRVSIVVGEHGKIQVKAVSPISSEDACFHAKETMIEILEEKGLEIPPFPPRGLRTCPVHNTAEGRI